MSNTNVELLVIHKGLSLVKDNRFQFVVCELDSFLALHLIQMGIPITHPMAPLVKIIVELVSSQWHVMFQHTLREGNKIVDWLTKRGASSVDVFKSWDGCPTQLRHTLVAKESIIQGVAEFSVLCLSCFLPIIKK